jgi:hypothetical protein
MIDDSPGPEQAEEMGRAGLCSRCLHVQVVESDRGTRFYLCRRSLTDPRFPRYPQIPVIACVGFESDPGPGD